MGTIVQDLRYGVRMLAKSPGFAAVAVLTLTLGIGANTALFSVVNGVLLNPLPFPNPDQLVTLHESKPNFESGSISYPNFLDWQKDNRTFSAMAIYRWGSLALTGTGDAEQVNGEYVSSDFFSLLGVKPLMGRDLAAGEDRVGAAPVALLSEGFWKRKFGSTPGVLGKTITLDGKAYAVVGVIPFSFHFMTSSFGPNKDVFLPIGQWNNNLLPNRGAGLGIHGIGRLMPGITVDQARADMTSVTHHLADIYPKEDQGIGATLIPLREAAVGKVQPFLLMLLGAVGFVLLIACVNVANLLLARSTRRTREFAIRAALGAGQGRVIRQLLTESLLLAAAGGVMGLLVAAWATPAALAILPVTLPRAEEISLDSRVLIFSAAASLLSGVLFGVMPALKTSRASLLQALQEGGRGGSGMRHRAHGALVVAEVAMALVLLIGAGLMIRTLAKLWRVNPGFDSHNVLAFGISLMPSMNTATPAAIRATLREINDTLESVPGIQASSLSWAATPIASDDEDLFWLEGEPKPTSEHDLHWAISYVVQEDYLKVMRTPLLRGRFFTKQDNERSRNVVVIDDVFARKFFGDQDPIGKHVHLADKEIEAEIVGVVGHVKQWGLDTDDAQSLRAELYIPYMQLPDSAMAMSGPGTGVMVRFDGAAPVIAQSIKGALKKMNGEQVMFGVQTMDEIIAQSLAARQFSMMLLASFAALALLLSSVGIYGVVAYLVGQRTQEIGIRMALGAQRSDVLRMVLGQGLRMALAGVAVGLAAALALTRLLAAHSMLFGVSATDPLTFSSVALLLTLIALAASFIPARRAVKVDPMVALRHE